MIFSEIDTVYDEERDSFGHKYNVIYSVGNRVVREWFKSFNNPFYQHNASWWSEGFNMFFATHLLNQVVLLIIFTSLIQKVVVEINTHIRIRIYKNIV